MKRNLFCLFLLAALALAGCSPQTSAGSPTPESTPVWTVVFPTAVVPSGDLPPKSGDFTPYFSAYAFPNPDIISGLSFDAAGNPWITTQQTSARWDGQAWVFTPFYDGLPLDIDSAGRVWVTSMDGSTLSAWVDGAWQVYGPDRGWTPVENYVYIPVVPGTQTDSDGNLWLTTAQDVRRFDGKTWKVFSQSEMTLPDPSEFDSFPIFSLALDDTSLWVGVCNWAGPGPLSGRAIRRYDGKTWSDPALPVDKPCVTALTSAPDGVIWAGVEKNLWQFNPASKTWTKFTLPNPKVLPESTRLGYISQIDLDPQGNPYVIASLCGGASCDVSQVQYRLLNGKLEQVSEVETPMKLMVLFDAASEPWIFQGDAIYRVENGKRVKVEPAPTLLAAAPGPDGSIWIIGGSGNRTAVWKLEK